MVESRGVGDREDHGVGPERARLLLDGRERRVLSEVRDAPTAAPESQAEGEQPQVVKLSRRACEQCVRPHTGSPAAGEPEQPTADDVAREVLLGDGRLAAGPALAQLVEVRKNDVGEHGVEREGAEHAVERRVGARLREARQGLGELLPGLLDRAARDWAGGLGFRCKRAPRGFCGGEPLTEMGLHRADALDVIVRVEAKAPVRPGRLEEPVSALPGSQEVDADAAPAAQLTDSQVALVVHGPSVQTLDI